MRNDSVSTAFEMILEEIDSVVTEVNSQGAAFIRNNDYPEAEASIEAGKKLTAFRHELESLKQKWIDGLDERTRQRIQVEPSMVATTIASAPKSSKTILVVKFPMAPFYSKTRLPTHLRRHLENSAFNV